MAALTESDVAAARRGDPAALHLVYQVLAPAIAGYLRSKGSDDPEALTQDVFVSLLPRLPKLHGGASGLRTLAFSIAHARMVDEVRKHASRPSPARFEPEADTRVAPSAENDVLDRFGDETVIRLLAGLDDDQRTVVALRIVAQLSLEETASVIGRSVGAVKQLQRRGLLALRTELLAAREGVTP